MKDWSPRTIRGAIFLGVGICASQVQPSAEKRKKHGQFAKKPPVATIKSASQNAGAVWSPKPGTRRKSSIDQRFPWSMRPPEMKE
jgi:hypothetical protein